MTYSGTMLSDLNAAVDNVLDLAKEAEPWEILAHAGEHLCDGVMTRGDVQAWNLMAEIYDELKPYSIYDKVRDEASND